MIDVRPHGYTTEKSSLSGIPLLHPYSIMYLLLHVSIYLQ